MHGKENVAAVCSNADRAGIPTSDHFPGAVEVWIPIKVVYRTGEGGSTVH